MLRRYLAWIVLALAGTAFAQHPVISTQSVTVNSSSSVTVTWTTDIPSDTMVFWGVGTDLYGIDAGATDCPTNDAGAYPGRCLGTGIATGVTTHSQTITGLQTGQFYNFAVRSRGFTAGAPDLNKSTTACAPSNCGQVQTTPASSAGSWDFGVGFTGSSHIVQGHSTYFGVNWYPLQGTASSSSVNLQWTSIPTGITISYPSEMAGTCSSSYNTGTNTLFWYDIVGCSPNPYFKLTASGGATPGTYTLQGTITSTGGTPAPKNVSYTIIIDAATTLAQGTPTSYPPVPCLHSTSKQMDGASPCLFGATPQYFDTLADQWGSWWCVPALNPRNPGACHQNCEQGAWYYDGGRGYYQLGDYFSRNGIATPTFTANGYTPNGCAVNWAENYYTYLSGRGYNTSDTQWEMFAKGEYMYSLPSRANNPHGSATVAGLATSSISEGGFYISAQNIRESTYALEVKHYNVKLGNADNSCTIACQVDILLGQLNQLFVDQNYPVYQPFMIGLAIDALTDCYADSACVGGYQDARIPVMAKLVSDTMWTVNDPKVGHVAYYSTGIPCSNSGKASFFYNNYDQAINPDGPGVGSGCGGSDYASLNNLHANIDGWLFKYTGDQTYSTRARTLFQASMLIDPGTFIGWMGKGFTQNMRTTLDMINNLQAPLSGGGYVAGQVKCNGCVIK